MIHPLWNKNDLPRGSAVKACLAGIVWSIGRQHRVQLPSIADHRFIDRKLVRAVDRLQPWPIGEDTLVDQVVIDDINLARESRERSMQVCQHLAQHIFGKGIEQVKYKGFAWEFKPAGVAGV